MDIVVNRKKPLFWIITIIVIISVPIDYVVIKQTRNSYFSNLNARALDELKVHITYLQSEMDNRHMITRIVGTDERVLSFMAHPNETQRLNQVNRFLSRILTTTGSIAYILNSKGKVLASGNWDAQDSFIGENYYFRPYFKASIMGETAQYVAIGAKSKGLGYFVSIPIHVKGDIVGVAVTKTNPQDLIMVHERLDHPFIITDDSGVSVISRPIQYLFHTVVQPAPNNISSPMGETRFLGVNLKPMTTVPIETVDRIQLITLNRSEDLKLNRNGRRFVLTHVPVTVSGWNAYLLWPINGLNTMLIQRLLFTLLVMIFSGLLFLYAVERWRHLKQIQEHAFRDPLTRLYTRLYMLESATALLAAHDRNSIAGVSAIMFDLDRFKMINDHYGHSAGDNVLVQVANVLIKECRDSDIPIRYGGEEFLIFVPTGDRQQVLQLAERIRLQVKKLNVKLAGAPIHLTCSSGIATHMPGEQLEKLIDRADQMMYIAKQNGRDQVKWEQDLSKETYR